MVTEITKTVHALKYATTIEVIDPITDNYVRLVVYKDMESGAMVGIDESYIANTEEPIYSPYNLGYTLVDPDDDPDGELSNESSSTEVLIEITHDEWQDCGHLVKCNKCREPNVEAILMPADNPKVLADVKYRCTNEVCRHSWYVHGDET